MQYSAEMRWFPSEDTCRSIILPWFNAFGKDFSDESRADFYLLAKGLTGHGIKLREGKMEVKVLHHDWGEFKISDQNSGKANMWCKYGFELKPGETGSRELIAAFAGPRTVGINQDWIRLDKQRLLVKYAIDPEKEQVKLADENDLPEQGCNVELTKVKLNFQKEYYTFGLEAFGKGTDLKKNLDLAVNEILANNIISGLSLNQSMSYPEFLQLNL